MPNFFISPSGSDSTGTGNILSPWQTHSKALTAMNPGDTCFCRGGTYNYTPASGVTAEGLILGGKDGTANAPLLFTAYGNEVPRVNQTIASDPGFTHDAMRIDSKFLTFDRHQLTNQQTGDLSGLGLHINGAQSSGPAANVIVSNCEIFNVLGRVSASAGQAGLLCNADDCKILGNYCHDIPQLGGVGIYNTGNRVNIGHNICNIRSGFGMQLATAGVTTDSVTFEYNFCYGCGIDFPATNSFGLGIGSPATNLNIRFNRCIANQRWGISIDISGSAASTCLCSNNYTERNGLGGAGGGIRGDAFVPPAKMGYLRNIMIDESVIAYQVNNSGEPLDYNCAFYRNIAAPTTMFLINGIAYNRLSDLQVGGFDLNGRADPVGLLNPYLSWRYDSGIFSPQLPLGYSF